MIRYIEKTLTTAQVKALNSTPIELVAAPGANKIIMVIGAFQLFIDYNSVAYNSQALALKMATDDLQTSPGNFLTSAADRARYMDFNGSATSGNVAVNSALQITASADPTTGDSPLTVRGTYIIIDA